MTRLRLILASLQHHARAHVGTLLGAVVAAAVLTGSRSGSVIVASDGHSHGIDPPLEDNFGGDLLTVLPVGVCARQPCCCRLRRQLFPKIFKH